MNILFVCSQNKRRSLTAEKIFDDFEYMDEELQDILRSYVEEYVMFLWSITA